MTGRVLEARFVFVLLTAMAVVVFLMVQSFLTILALATVLAVVFEPLQQLIVKRLHSPTLAAIITTLTVLALVLLPLLLFGYQLIEETAGVYGYLTDRAQTNGLSDFFHGVEAAIQRLVPGISIDSSLVISYVRDALGWLVSNIGLVFAGFARSAFGFALMLLAFFYFVRDGEQLMAQLVKISPLSDKHEKQILHALGQAIHAVVRGTLVIALIQGLVAGIGFTLFGVPNPALWAAALMVTSFIPILGTSLVQIPVITYVFFTTGDMSATIGLSVWAVVAVGLIDNLLRPELVGRGTRMHPITVLFGVLGGVALFGPVGLIIGPIVMALMLALLHIWLQIIGGPKAHTHSERVKITS